MTDGSDGIVISYYHTTYGQPIRGTALPYEPGIKEEAMKRMLILVGLLLGVMTTTGRAQTRVGVSLSFGDPYLAGQVVIGRPYYHRYAQPYYYEYRPYYRPAPVIVVEPRYYREPRVIIVRPHRNYRHRHYHRW